MVKTQLIPLVVAFLSASFFVVFLVFNIKFANSLFNHEPVILALRTADLLLGLYLYLKTSVDFAVFIGSMMAANPGWKNRIVVEWGTSLGNFVGTVVVIWVWVIFKSASPVLEGVIVIVASFVLLELAAGTLTRVPKDSWFYKITYSLISSVRRFTSPFLFWMPDVEGTMSGKKLPNLTALLAYSFTVPFILGTDDFASYISVFSVVNVFSFATGVILGHMILLAGIFSAPKIVEKIFSQSWFAVLAVTTFIIIFLIGITDGGRILLSENPIFLAAALLIIVLSPTHHLIRSGFARTREAALSLLRGT